MLYRGADNPDRPASQPFAVLTPQETEKLFTVMPQRHEKDGKERSSSSLKLHEVLAVSDRVAVLRSEYIGDTDALPPRSSR